MKISTLYFFLLLTFFIGSSQFTKAQVTAGDCATATNICTNGSFAVDPSGFGAIEEFDFNSNISNPQINPNCCNSGCLLSGELNSTWMVINIATNGTLEFSMGTPGTFNCFDWIMWPYDPATTCNGIISNTLPPVSCNWNGACDGMTGMASPANLTAIGGDPLDFEAPLNVQCGEQYIVCLSNFSSATTNVPLNFFGTAQVDCQTFTPITVNDETICEGQCANLTANGGVTYNWAASPDLSGTTGPSVTACPPGAGTFTYDVTGTGSCGTGTATSTVTVLPIGDPACSTPCNFTLSSISQGACDPATNTFDITGSLEFTNPPANGQLIIEDCNGNQQTFNAPFVSPTNYALTGITPDGTTNCTVTAYFTDDPTCTVTTLPIDHPLPCACPADIGTFTTNVTGSTNTTGPYNLCFGDNLNIASNGDGVDPDDAFDPTIVYDPGQWLMVFSCPPTITPPDDINTDPCLLGVFSTDDGNWDIPNNIGDGSTLYFVPITMYSMADGFYSVLNGAALCYDLGPTYEVTYLPQIVSSNPTEDCLAGSFTITVNGGDPAVNGTQFTASNLMPATANFVNTTANDGGTIVIDGLQDGDMYSFDITDVNGCPITISGGPFVGLPVADAGPDDQSCALTYNLAATPSIGTGTWTGTGTFTPSANDPNATVTVASPGSYTFTWTEDNGGGCVSSDDVTIDFSDLAMNTTTVDATCGTPDGEVNITATGANGAVQYSIDNGATFQGTGNFTGLAAGTYNVVVEDALGCQVTGTATVNNLGAPSIDNVTPTDPSCAGVADGAIDITASGGTGAINYSIDNGATFQGGGAFTGLAAGTYDIMIEDANGCQATAQVTLTDPAGINASSTPTDLTCFQDNTGQIDITASGGTGALSYSVDGGATFQAGNVFNGLASGNYNIVVEDANGCQTAFTETLNEPTALTLTFSIVDETCQGSCDGSATVIPAGGTPNYTYAWSGGSGGANDTQTQGLCAGNYDLTVTDANGCTADTLNFPVTGPIAVSIDAVATVDASCNGNCDGEIDITSTGGTQYSIDGGATFQPGNTFAGLCAGNYTIVVQDANGCSDDTQATINEPTQPGVTVSPDTTICLAGTATLTADVQGGTGPYTYAWNPGGSTNQTINVSPVNNTTYTVTATDANGCSAGNATVDVSINPTITLDVSPSQAICPGGTANITANASGGDGGPYTYVWDDGTNTFNGQNQSVSPSTTTIYTVTVDDGCETPTSTAQVVVAVNPVPVMDLVVDNPSGCLPHTVTFTDNSIPSGSDCFWDFGDGTTSTDCGSVSHTYTTPGCFDVSLSITTSAGCSNDTTINSMVCAYEYANAQFSFSPTDATILNTEIDFTNQSTNATAYEWDFAGLGTSNATNPSFEFPNSDPGTYPVCLVATNPNACNDTTCLDVIINDEFIIYVPNAFTPDDDGKNEVFLPVISGADAETYELYIFDRWGELVFESYSLNQGWDGTFKGQNAKSDVYVWKIKVKAAANNEKKEFVGHVTLLR